MPKYMILFKRDGSVMHIRPVEVRLFFSLIAAVTGINRDTAEYILERKNIEHRDYTFYDGERQRVSQDTAEKLEKVG